MIGQHLLLSPVSTVVKPTYSVSDHRPNPTQRGSRNALGGITSRRHARLVEEHRFDLHVGVLDEIVGLITCRRRATPAQDRKTTSMDRRRVSSPCEDNVNGGQVDGREVSRTGVQVERVES